MTDTCVRGILLDARTDLPRRFALYRLAADAALDAGDDGMAMGLRWLALYGRSPILIRATPCGQGQWGWYGCHGRPAWYIAKVAGREYSWRDYGHHLPGDVWRHISPRGNDQAGFVKQWTGFDLTVLAAARAVDIEANGEKP